MIVTARNAQNPILVVKAWGQGFRVGFKASGLRFIRVSDASGF